MAHPIGYDFNVKTILGDLHTVPVPGQPARQEVKVAQPFVTISREPGAGGWTLAQQLVAELNRRQSSEQPWTCWDRELVERVAGDLQISDRLIEHFEDRNRSWLTDFMTSLSHSDKGAADDERIYKRVAMTIRSLASAGRTVIVGRGGVFLTKGMAAGIHVRLVAPLEYRIQFMMHEHNLTHDRAKTHLRELEHNRHVFLKRYWNIDSMHSENFTVTFNTSTVSTEQMVLSLLPLVITKG
jgi:cytidylate kinase